MAIPAANSSQPIDARFERGGRFGVGGGNGGAQPRQRRLPEQRVEGRDEPGAILSNGLEARTQAFVLRQPREQGGPLVAVEFIVDQSGEPLVVVRHRTS